MTLNTWKVPRCHLKISLSYRDPTHETYCFGTYFAVAIRIVLPFNHSGTVSSPKIAMSMPKIPKGSAAPDSAIQSPMKNVQAKDTAARTMAVMTKQSALAAP